MGERQHTHANKAREAKARCLRSEDDEGKRSDDRQANKREAEDVEERSTPPTPVIYEVIHKLGEEEMARPVTSLWWSGVAAGLSISFSLFSRAILQTHLPDASWRPLVASFGYSVGFIMVVLSRQQLFTENTLTVVLPVMAELTPRNFAQVARIWSIVLLAVIWWERCSPPCSVPFSTRKGSNIRRNIASTSFPAVCIVAF
jgi:hypothetical protein